MDEEYSIPDMETIFHNLHGASYFGRIDLSDAYYQIEFDEKKYMHNQHISEIVEYVPTNSGIEKLFFIHPELHRINTQKS